MNLPLGIALKLASTLAFTAMASLVKLLDGFPTGQVVFFRSFFAVLPVVFWLATRGELSAALRTKQPLSHVRRGLSGSAGMFCGFAALALLPLPDATALSYAAPLITVVLAALVLKERVRVYRWSAVLVGFLGVLVMLSPHLSPSRAGGQGALGVGFALAGATFAAFATIQVRVLTRTEATGTIVLYFSLLASAAGLATSLLGWKAPGPGEALLLILIGVSGGVGQILMTQSFRYADASLIASFDYVSMIWALLVGWIVFAEPPLPAVVAGAAIVAASGIFVIWRERSLGIKRTKTRKAASARIT